MNRIKALSGSVMSPLISAAANIVLLYIVYTICRIEFLLVNIDFFEETLRSERLWKLFLGGIALDTPGIFYCNAIYLLMMLLPFHKKENTSYYRACKWYYLIINSFAIIANFADSIYFRYTMHRSTADVFSEFSNETNLMKITGVEILSHWYLVLILFVLVWGMAKLYVTPSMDIRRQALPRYYILSTLSLIVAVITCVGAIRGGFLNHWWNYVIACPLLYISYRLFRRYAKSDFLKKYTFCVPLLAAVALLVTAPLGGWRHRDIRPVSLSNAYTYTSRPIETALVLNTPFSLIRSIGKNPFADPGYFNDKKELAKIYNPVHNTKVGSGANQMQRKNVVLIIVESFGADYIGALNVGKQGFVSRTPFIDSLANSSALWEYSFSNGRKSIDAMPSLLASIPMFEKPFILTPKALNKIDGLPANLASIGYETAFFHGARTGSMGFDAFAKSIGFVRYYGREDFDKDKRFGGEKEFDGYWGIWDEPFLQFFAATLTDFRQPFFATLFTASSHHPFRVPDKYKGKFPEEDIPIQKCIRYTDNALRLFFDTAKKQPWYENTLFIITADHSNESLNAEYRTDIGGFRIPIIFYDPGSEIKPGIRKGVAQQIDVMPTILSYLGYSSPYLAFGKDLLAADSRELGGKWAVNYLNGTYQFVDRGYVLQFNGKEAVGLYSIDDEMMKNNLIDNKALKPLITSMTRSLKAIIQTYMDRMTSGNLTAE